MNKLSREALNVAADRCEEQGDRGIAGGLRMLAREPSDGDDSFLSVQTAIEEILRGVIVNYTVSFGEAGRVVGFEVRPRPDPNAMLCTYCGRVMSLACGCPGSRAAADEEEAEQEAEQEAEVREHAATCAGIGHGSDPCDCGYQETKK